MTSAKVTAKITYSKSGTQPPVYLAGTFSTPAWEPMEMEYTTEGEEHEFFKEVLVDQNEEYQYKFRIGLGDWWVLNEEAPTGMYHPANSRRQLSTKRYYRHRLGCHFFSDPPYGLAHRLN